MTIPVAPLSTTTGRVLHWAALYDALMWVMTHGQPSAFRRTMANLAQLAPGERVLDIGCGTGSLALIAKTQVGPTGVVTGVDASPSMVARATRKAKAAGLDVTFRTGLVEALPCPDAHVDVVMSTLMFHHLPRPVRITCAHEMRRVLVRGGRALIVDFPRGQSAGSIIRHFHRHGHVRPDEVLAALQHADLAPVSSGPVGAMNLHYALARKAE